MSEGALSIKGLWTAPNDYGNAPPGSLAVAHNVWFNKPGVVQPRPGFELGNGSVEYSSAWGQLVRLLEGHYWSTGRLLGVTEVVSGTTAADYYGLVENSSSPYWQRIDTVYDSLYVADSGLPLFSVFRTFDSATFENISDPPPWTSVNFKGHNYIKTKLGLSKHSQVTIGKMDYACVSQAPDITVTATGTTGVLRGNSQYAYRVAFSRNYSQDTSLYRRWSGFEVVGPPSQPCVLTIPKYLVTSLTRSDSPTTNKVAVVTAAEHGFSTGQYVTLFPGEPDFLTGSKQITVTSSTAFYYIEEGANVTNTSTQYFYADGVNANIEIAVPTDYSDGDSYRVYRSMGSISDDVAPDDELYQVYQGLIPKRMIGVTSLVQTQTPDKVRFTLADVTVTHNYLAGDWVALTPGETNFPAKTYQITAVASNYIEWTPADSKTATSYTDHLISCRRFTMTDFLEDSLMGETLYTSPSQEGIAAENGPPLNRSCDLMASFRGCLFVAGPPSAYEIEVTLSSVTPTSGGLQSGDTFKVNVGMSSDKTACILTAGAAESILTRTFKISTASSAAQRVAETARSIVKILNGSLFKYDESVTWDDRDRSLSCEAFYVSEEDSLPGKMLIRSTRTACTPFKIVPSRPGAFYCPDLNYRASCPPSWNLQFSKQDQPESFSAVNTFSVGMGTVTGLIPTKDSLIILTTQGIYRLTGSSPEDFRVDPLDLSVNCSAPLTVKLLRNKGYALADKGIVEITDSSVKVISMPISDSLRTEHVWGTDPKWSFAISDELRGIYIFCPAVTRFGSNTGGVCGKSVTQYVYSEEYEAWTTWGNYTPSNPGVLCGLVLQTPYGIGLDSTGYLNWTSNGFDPWPGRILFASNHARIILAGREERAAYYDVQEGYENGLCTVDQTRRVPGTIVYNGNQLTWPATGTVTCQVGDAFIDANYNCATVTATAGGQDATLSSTVVSGQEVYILRRFPVTVQFNPLFAGTPGTGHQFQYVDLFFRQLSCYQATVSLAGGMSASFTDLPVLGSDLGTAIAASFTAQQALTTGQRIKVRTWVPVENSRGDVLHVKFQLAEAMGRLELEGILVGQRITKGGQR